VHGGTGVVAADGRVGSLRLDHSGPAEIRRFAGRPDFAGTGTFDAAFVGFPPWYRALGYECSTRRSQGIDPGAYRPTHHYCRTVYFVNPRTGTFAAFWSDSPHFHTPFGTRPGMGQERASRLEHSRARTGPFPGIVRMTSTAELILEAYGCRWVGKPIPLCFGGRIGDVALESSKHGVGLLFE
jgi:hypothetical protein